MVEMEYTSFVGVGGNGIYEFRGGWWKWNIRVSRELVEMEYTSFVRGGGGVEYNRTVSWGLVEIEYICLRETRESSSGMERVRVAGTSV